MYNFIIGANDTGYHYENVNYGRDFEGKVGDLEMLLREINVLSVDHSLLLLEA